MASPARRRSACLALSLACSVSLVGVGAAGAGAVGVEQRLQEAVSVRPQSARAHLELVDWHLTWNDTDKALSSLEHALEVDPDHAWRYHQRSGDILYEYSHDINASKTAYKEALEGNPRARRSILRYGMMQIWHGEREEAEALFEGAVEAGLLREAHQRPLEEFMAEIPSDKGAWIQADSYLLLEDTMEQLAHPKVVEMFQQEYAQWTLDYGSKDALVSMESEPKAAGRHLQFWIHRPHYEDGIWRDVCAIETPKICQALKALNESGVTKIHAASLEILENGALARPRCHTTNSELFIDMVLQAPEASEEFGSPIFTAVGNDTRPWVAGEVSVLDGSFEHVLANQARGQTAVILRLAIRHPQLPCAGSFEECGAKGLVGNILWHLKRMIFGAPSSFGIGDEL